MNSTSCSTRNRWNKQQNKKEGNQEVNLRENINLEREEEESVKPQQQDHSKWFGAIFFQPIMWRSKGPSMCSFSHITFLMNQVTCLNNIYE